MGTQTEAVAQVTQEWSTFTRRYGTLVMDPPWKYRNKRVSWAAERRYPCLSLDELSQLPVANLCQPDAILFLWTTQTFLEASFGLLRKWGFDRRTIIVWVKSKGLGTGFWLRNQCEFCLVATRGKVKPFRSSQRNLIVSPRRKHSQKPEEFWELIEALPLIEPRLELFAREKRPGWDAWGNEV